MTPDIHLRTGLVLDEHGRIRSTREPEPAPGPLFTLIRSASSCVWAVRADVPGDLAAELGRLAGEEPPIEDPQAAPLHVDTYLSLVRGQVVSGPAFTFPDKIALSIDVAPVDTLHLLERNFRGWTTAEIPGRAPILAVMDGGYAVSVCFCARSSEIAAEAGVETAASFRGRGFAPRVTAAWAAAIRASGRIPLYSTSWGNAASLTVARKLGLVQYASDWSLVGHLDT
jgi:GNAT acetyltransferase